MQQAEAYARERGLAGIWLDTFAFQARGFLRKAWALSVFGTLEDHPRGSARAALAFTAARRLDGVQPPNPREPYMAQSLFLLPGDGIGTEIMAEVEKVIAWINSRGQTDFSIDSGLVGGCGL